MPRTRTLRTVDTTFLDTAPFTNTLTHDLPCPASDAFAALEDTACWKAFLGLDVTWTSDAPYGVGTTRTVVANGQSIDEIFHAWEDGVLMGFHFARTTLPLAAFAEEWKITPVTDATSRVQWRYGFEWGGPLAPVLGRAFDAFFGWNGKRSLPKLADYLATR